MALQFQYELDFGQCMTVEGQTKFVPVEILVSWLGVLHVWLAAVVQVWVAALGAMSLLG